MEIEPWSAYEGTVRMRRGGAWRVKPEAEPMEGRRVYLTTSGGTEAEGLYAGEWAMTVEGPSGEDEPIWIASGDVANFRKMARADLPYRYGHPVPAKHPA